jgi:hypothetical protein
MPVIQDTDLDCHPPDLLKIKKPAEINLLRSDRFSDLIKRCAEIVSQDRSMVRFWAYDYTSLPFRPGQMKVICSTHKTKLFLKVHDCEPTFQISTKATDSISYAKSLQYSSIFQ